MMITFTQAFVIYLSLAVIESVENKGCQYSKHLNPGKKNGERQIATLSGDRYSVKDPRFGFTYYIGVCTEAMDPYPEDGDSQQRLTGSGVVQQDKDGKLRSVGRYDQADIMAGDEWVLLEYNGGEPYGHHCLGENNQHENRTARILFICDTNNVDPIVEILEEQNNKTGSCYYLFEISTTTVCPKQPIITIGLSVGSVLLIVFFSVVMVYILGGCLYNRFILGAKGLDQIPNRAFWQDFGNLQADGCDLVCRTGKHRQPRTYKGIGDDQLGDNDDQTITDENLLPM